MTRHTLGQGEDIVSVAEPSGVPWEKVWAHPENEPLRRKRSSPHLLCAGDVVFVPEPEPSKQSGATEKRHRFRLKQAPLRFRARLFERKGDADSKREVSAREPSEYEEEQPAVLKEQPIAGAPYQLLVEGYPDQLGNTDDEGFVDVELSPGARKGVLVLYPGDEEKERRIDLRWRHLDPVEEVSGVAQRLTNLGWPCPSAATEVTPQIEDAIAAFQAQHGLEVNGRIDAGLRDKLVEVHGS